MVPDGQGCPDVPLAAPELQLLSFMVNKGDVGVDVASSIEASSSWINLMLCIYTCAVGHI